MLLRKIPFFKDIVVISFLCEHCGYKNHEFTPLNPLADRGIKLSLKVSKPEDLNRMVIANLNSVIYIPELEFEVPKLPKGLVSTLQGAILNFVDDLSYAQDQRKELDPPTYEKIQIIIEKLGSMASGDPKVLPFYFILNDPSGNSFIANPFAPLIDVNLKEERYERTKEQMIDLGFVSDIEVAQTLELKQKYEDMEKKGIHYVDNLKKTKDYKYTDKDTHEMMQKMQGFSKHKDAHKLDHSKTVQEQDLDSRLSILEVSCFGCGDIGHLNSLTIEIPFFKEICIMSFTCDKCGYRSTEVKTLGEISKMGKRITLTVKTKEDLNRDIFKSESAVVKIHEIEFEMSSGSLGSFYTTVEGLFEKLLQNLKFNNPFVGDSTDHDQKKKWDEFLEKLEKMKSGEMLPFTLELDDALDNCFVLNPFYPEKDPSVVVEEYQRSNEQNEDLGLNQMKV